ncbi:MAG: ribulose-phosphate 3-epimerase [Chloroflexi bacterium]|nr:ribulose-phosphate 3-epimerase [Chloroflexota bacterium]
MDTRAEREILIAPSILSADFGRLGEEVREAESAGADLIHVDVMDGRFVPNITVGPLVVRALRPVTRLPIEVHLMIEEPERYIGAFVEAGAALVTVHVETCPHLHRTLEQIRECGAAPAVTLNPATPLISLEPVLEQVEQVLIMTVDPGFGGQKMIPMALDKVRSLRRWIKERGLNCRIEVDGGVNLDTLAQVLDAGADILVMGAAIFAADGGIQEAMGALRAEIQRLRPALAGPG